MASGLVEEEAGLSPETLFERWFSEAASADTLDPSAMTLSTATKDGKPSSRIVLLKGYDSEGYIFYTNYGSRKAIEIDSNPFGCLLFYWAQFERQIRIEGSLLKTNRKESEEYFKTRPLDSRLSAHASPQSTVIPDRELLVRRLEEMGKRFGENVPLPENWGGYRLRPDTYEFWQGREARLHDRIRFRKANNVWIRERLAP